MTKTAAVPPATRYTAVSLFAGCGGSDVGLKSAGITPIWANEINKAACELYTQITGDDHIECADIRLIDRIPKADILAGCYPCQGYSQGGRRKSADGVNYLYREFDRALRQVKPLAFIVENVDGMRFSQNAELLRNQLTRFRSSGYCVSQQILDAKDFGLAQDRKRLFLVGIRSKRRIRFKFPRSSHGKTAGQLPYATLRDVIWRFRKAAPGSFCDEPLHWYYLSRNRRRTWGQQAHCVVAHWRHVGLHPDSPRLTKLAPDRWEFAHNGCNPRRLSYLECAALQGFPKPGAFKAGSVRQRFRAIGNAVPPPLFAAIAGALVAQLDRR
jgi:DNA (cytosine-5)-methyltransferase 1